MAKSRASRAPVMAAVLAGSLFTGWWAYRAMQPLRHTVAAGGAGVGYGGDGGQATAAGFDRPQGLALDGEGNLYIADSNNHAIRRVDRRGIVTTVAGNGKERPSGDGGPAAQASLDLPGGLAVAPSGEVYIAATTRVWRIERDGRIQTVAGGGTLLYGEREPLFLGDIGLVGKIALDDEGRLIIVGNSDHTLFRVAGGRLSTLFKQTGGGYYPTQRGDNSRLTLVFPAGVAVDPRRGIFVSDEWVSQVVRFHTAPVH